MDEIWKPIVGYEGLYEVSNLGRVNNLKRDWLVSANPSGMGGYLCVNLRKDKKSKMFAVHILVCEAFHGSRPFEGALALHKDDVKVHNFVDNLYWGTHADNMKDRMVYGNINSEMDWNTVREIRKKRSEGMSVPELASLYNKGTTTIQNIVTNKTWIG